MADEQLQPLTESEIEGFEALWEWSKDEGDIDDYVAAHRAIPRFLAEVRRLREEYKKLSIYTEAIEADLTNTRFVNSDTEQRLAIARLAGARAAFLRVAEEAEIIRQKILGDPSDPSWTEHFADLRQWLEYFTASDERLAALLEDKNGR